MRRSVLTVGILLVLAGALIINAGTQVLVPLADAFGLATHVTVEIPVFAPTLLTIAPANYTDVTVSLERNVRMIGSFSVSGDREIALYVMDQGNFTRWRSGQPSAVLLAVPSASVNNFTFTTRVDGTYHFVFDNEDTTRRTVIFSLSLAKEEIILHPVLEYLGYLFAAVGVVFCVLGVRGGKREPQPVVAEVRAWTCQFCGAENPPDQGFCSECGRSRQ